MEGADNTVLMSYDSCWLRLGKVGQVVEWQETFESCTDAFIFQMLLSSWRPDLCRASPGSIHYHCERARITGSIDVGHRTVRFSCGEYHQFRLQRSQICRRRSGQTRGRGSASAGKASSYLVGCYLLVGFLSRALP